MLSRFTLQYTSPLLVQSAGFYLGGRAILAGWKGQLLSEVHCFGRTNFLRQTVVLTMGKSHRGQGLKNVEVDNGDLSVQFTALRKSYFWHLKLITGGVPRMTCLTGDLIGPDPQTEFPAWPHTCLVIVALPADCWVLWPWMPSSRALFCSFCIFRSVVRKYNSHMLGSLSVLGTASQFVLQPNEEYLAFHSAGQPMSGVPAYPSSAPAHRKYSIASGADHYKIWHDLLHQAQCSKCCSISLEKRLIPETK